MMQLQLLIETLIYLRNSANDLLVTSDFGGNDLFRLKREMDCLKEKLPEFEDIRESENRKVVAREIENFRNKIDHLIFRFHG